jgi:hypothetical protein
MGGFVINIPAGQGELREEIEEQLAAYARVSEAPRPMGLDEIKLIVEIIAGTTGIAANVAAIATFLLLLKDRYQKAGKPSGLTLARFAGPTVPLEQVDAETLRKLVGGER